MIDVLLWNESKSTSSKKKKSKKKKKESRVIQIGEKRMKGRKTSRTNQNEKQMSMRPVSYQINKGPIII